MLRAVIKVVSSLVKRKTRDTTINSPDPFQELIHFHLLVPHFLQAERERNSSLLKEVEKGEDEIA